jgi:hypothetical protein
VVRTCQKAVNIPYNYGCHAGNNLKHWIIGKGYYEDTEKQRSYQKQRKISSTSLATQTRWLKTRINDLQGFLLFRS